MRREDLRHQFFSMTFPMIATLSYTSFHTYFSLFLNVDPLI